MLNVIRCISCVRVFYEKKLRVERIFVCGRTCCPNGGRWCCFLGPCSVSSGLVRVELVSPFLRSCSCGLLLTLRLGCTISPSTNPQSSRPFPRTISLSSFKEMERPVGLSSVRYSCAKLVSIDSGNIRQHNSRILFCNQALIDR